MKPYPIESTQQYCTHCRNGWFEGTEIECVNGVLIDIDVAHEGWQRDVEYPAAPCVSKSGKWPKRDRGCQSRLEEWAARGVEEEPSPHVRPAPEVPFVAPTAARDALADVVRAFLAVWDSDDPTVSVDDSVEALRAELGSEPDASH